MSVSMSEKTDLAKTETGESQLVVFSLAGCEAALGIRQVREIIRIGEITRMPKAPAFLEGVINLRGKIIPLLDLRKRFHMPLIDRTDQSRILVVEIKDQMLGFLVDRVVEVLKASPAMVEPAPEPVLTVGPEYLEGLIRLERRLILLFNLKSLLTIADVKALPEWEAHTGPEGGNLGH